MPRADSSEVVIAGGGMAGSLLALVLGRAGRTVTVVDPRRDPPPVFRNEKLGHAQIAILRRLGVLDCFEAACWPAVGEPGAYPDNGRPALHDCGAPHQAWLRAVRAAWPEAVRFVEGVVETAGLSDAGQAVRLADGATLEARLLVLATGRMPALRHALGLERRMLSPGHSVCLGFSVATPAPVPAQVTPVRFGTGLGYVSLFPMPGETRVNVFSYRALSDPWTRRMSADPLAGLAELAPGAARALEGARVVRRCEARGTDLYTLRGHERLPGLIAIGDAFHAPCPASGTGMLRILTDIEALAERCIPTWFATPGLGPEKVARFYADPVKRRTDAESLRRSRRGRAHAVDRGPYWTARRLVGTIKRAVRHDSEARIQR